MSEIGDEGGESLSEGGDNKSDEVPDETSDAPDEKPDEEQFNPNDDVPDESPDEGLFNPNDDVLDESPDEGLFNPNDDVPDESPDEKLFNPNDDVPDESPDEGLFNPNDDVPDESPDEGLFNPNDDVPDESPDEGLFNPNDDVPDESPDEGLFNPNDDVLDESPDEGLFNPNDDVPDDNPDNELDDPIKEYESESEPEKQPEGINNPSNSGNVLVIEPVQKPEYESEEKPEEFEVVTPNGELERPGESPEVMEIRADLEEWGYEPEYDSEMEPKSEYEQEPEQIPGQELETDLGQEQEEHIAQEEFKRDKEGNIVLDAEQMKLFGSRVSSQEEMEVEILEEGLEELFDSYEEQGLENDRGLETSIKLEQESSQEQLEPEQEAQEFNRQQQGERVNQEMDRAQEQELSQELSEKSQAKVSHTSKIIDPKSMEIIREKDEKENVQESSSKKIQENEQELVWEKEQSQEQSQEIEQESIREIHQNIEVIQEEIQEQIEEQKEPTLRESDEFFEEQYKQETGRRPIYAGKETRGFIEWKEHLNEKEEKQEEKNKLLQEKEKEIKKQSKEIRESKEEWAQYLANSIKGAEFPENIKVELNELLEKYEDLRKLLEKLKNREIAEEEFEKEVKEFEHILIEKRYIARSLFMNFDWFRRYYNGMIRKAGKRVAHFYISRKTREFLSYIFGRIEQLQNIGNSHENAEKFKEFLEKSFQIKEKWALLLNRLIREAPNKEIFTEVKEELEAVIKTYCEIRAILFSKNILEVDKEKLIQERIEKCNPRFFELFEILKRFLGAYANYSRKWMEQSLIIDGKKTVRRLSQKLKAIKEEAVQEILNGDNSMLHKFKEILRVNLYKSTELNMNEKSKLIKIIQKKDISEEDKKVIKSLLGRLSKRELITILKNDFKNDFLPKPDLSYEKIEQGTISNDKVSQLLDFSTLLLNEEADANETPQKKELIREEFSKSDEFLPHKQPSKADMLAIQALQLGILTIYYICRIFPKNSEIDKKFFSASEINYILDKHSQFFYTNNKSLKEKDLIRYFGTVTRKKKSNEKIYIITEKGIKFTEEIIEIKRRDYPILFDKLIATLEKRYIEYNKDLINSESKIIIRSQEDINNYLKKIAGDNKVELLTSYRSDHFDIEFRCRKCKKQFTDSYQLIKSRKSPKIFCPYCFPELKSNMYLSEELRRQISKYAFIELEKISLHQLSKNRILDILEYIKKLVYNFIEPQIIEKNSEFKEFVTKHLGNIVGFLTEVKRLYETNQFINLSEISLLFHDNSIVSESMWVEICRIIIKYLREEFDFNIRTRLYDIVSDSDRQSIRIYKNLYRLIKGDDGMGRIITYLNTDYKSEIEIYYDGKCHGVNGYCRFNIDYRFLPAFSYDHRLEKYNTIVKREEYKYITPKTILGGSFNGALAKMKSQIGGMDLRCRNCHSSRHHKMYHFLPIFNFLKSLHISDIDVNATYVLDSVNLLAKKYFEYTKKSIKLSKKYTQAQNLSRIRNQLFRLIKKKYIVEYLFGANYICPACQKANINEHLTCFEAHHTNETIFENGLQKIIFSLYYFKSTKWLIKNLITQECIYVCRNCHTMITTINYNENARIILENEIDALYVNTFYDNLYKKVNEKSDIIIHWKSQLKNILNSIPNPFLKMFDYGESIDSALICIYYICEIFSQDTKKDFFTAEELNYIQEKSSSYFKLYKNSLIDLEYIQYEKRLLQYRGFGFNKDIFKITFKGTIKAKKLIKERSGEFPDEFKELVSHWEHRIRNYNSRKQQLSAFDVVLICIYFICNKGKIDFFLNAFHYVIDKENSYFSKHRKKLITLEYITEYQKTANSFKEIDIAPKGGKRAEELISLMKRDHFERYQKLISDWEKRYDEYLKTIKN